MKAIIPAAGEGTRLRPHTFTCPKPMIPIANKPAMDYQIGTLKRLGINEIIIITGYKKEELINFIKTRNYGINIRFIEQKNQLGIAHAILQAKNFIKEDFIVLLGDTIFDADLRSVLELHKKTKAYATLSVEKAEDPSKFGVVVQDNGNVRKLLEKPKDPPSNLVITGFYIFNPLIFEFIKKTKKGPKGEYEITDAIQQMLESGNQISCLELTGKRFDVGRPEHLLRANTNFLAHIKNKNLAIGKPNISGKAEIGKNTRIVGRVNLIGNVSIGENCVIGPNTEIINSSIQDGCEIKNTYLSTSMIQKNSVIEYYGRIMESIIGKNCVLIRQVKRKGVKGRIIGIVRKTIGHFRKKYGLKTAFFLSDESQVIIGQEKLDTEEFKKK